MGLKGINHPLIVFDNQRINTFSALPLSCRHLLLQGVTRGWPSFQNMIISSHPSMTCD